MAEAYRENPFTPSFGEVPAYLAGRGRLLSEMSRALSRQARSPELTTLVSGARGTGKTALLAKIAEIAQMNGWVAVKTIASEGMLEDVFQHAVRDSAHLVESSGQGKQLTGIGIAQVLNLEWSNSMEEPGNWRIRVEALLDQLEASGSGLLIAVDEVDPSVEEMVRLASIYQLLVMDNRRVALIMAGLPHNIEKAKANKSISFVRRAQQRRLGRVSDLEVEHAMRKTVEQADGVIGDEALRIAVDAADGFPFMIQLVGYRMWEEAEGKREITAADASAGAALAAQEMKSYILESTYRELSDGDLQFCKAMLADDGPSRIADVQDRLGKPSGHVGTYKERLLKAGVIGEADRGAVDFDLPGFREFLRERLGA